MLLWNFEVLPDGFWGELFLLWPFGLAAVAAGLLLSRVHPWAGSLAALAVLAGALFGAWWVADSDDRTPLLPVVYESISVPLDGTQTAQVNLTASSGVLALSGGAAPGQLLAGGFEGMAFPAAQYSVRMSSAGGQQTLEINLQGSWEVSFPPQRPISNGRWLLQHAGGVPIDIGVYGGATTLDLDLEDLTVRSLDVAAGAADVAVAMPANAGRTDASFRIGGGRLNIEIPAGVAARIELGGSVSSVDIDTARFPAQGDGRYASPDFENAANRVTISIDAGAGDVSVR
ncbi:MAG: hypothetical protein OXI70_14655 [Chloroflexota bacterium]|nr:hypothetical protein [Chloroflexota bacterium]